MMISVTKASRIAAILHIASHEGMPEIGQTIRHASGTTGHYKIVESPVTEDCLRTAQTVIDGKLKLPATAAGRMTACVMQK